MNLRPGSNDSLALSYGGLGKAVGVIGTALPLVLALGKMFFSIPWNPELD